MSDLKDYLNALATNPANVRHRNIAHRAVNLGYATENKCRDSITYSITQAGRDFIGLSNKEQTDGKMQDNEETHGDGQREDHAVDAGPEQGREEEVLTHDDIKLLAWSKKHPSPTPKKKKRK